VHIVLSVFLSANTVWFFSFLYAKSTVFRSVFLISKDIFSFFMLSFFRCLYKYRMFVFYFTCLTQCSVHNVLLSLG
jgi:hypothetical protein